MTVLSRSGNPHSWLQCRFAPATAILALFLILFTVLPPGNVALISRQNPAPSAHANGASSQSPPPADAQPPGSSPAGWTPQTVANEVSFSLPASFVSNSDFSPHFEIVGGGTMNSAGTAFRLLLGVGVDSTPGVTVASAARQLKSAYSSDRLVAETTTPYGTELAFAMPGDMSYTVYLAPLQHGVREIIINRNGPSAGDPSLVNEFLATVHNVQATSPVRS